jgi:hypothetical protein
LELNYHKIAARAYATLHPVPSEADVFGYIEEYAGNWLLFVYNVDGRLWGAWDCPTAFLPRYKTASDRRGPSPPEPEFSEWKKRYRTGNKSLPKCFGKFSGTFPHGVGVGAGGGDGEGYGVGSGCIEVVAPDWVEREWNEFKRNDPGGYCEFVTLNGDEETAWDAWARWAYWLPLMAGEIEEGG